MFDATLVSSMPYVVILHQKIQFTLVRVRQLIEAVAQIPVELWCAQVVSLERCADESCDTLACALCYEDFDECYACGDRFCGDCLYYHQAKKRCMGRW